MCTYSESKRYINIYVEKVPCIQSLVTHMLTHPTHTNLTHNTHTNLTHPTHINLTYPAHTNLTYPTHSIMTEICGMDLIMWFVCRDCTVLLLQTGSLV